MTEPREDDAGTPALRRHWRSRHEEFRDEIEQHVTQARDQIEHRVANARDQFEEANERIKARTGRDLIVAIAIGLLLGGALVASLVIVKWVFVPIVLAVSALGVYELSRALRGAGRTIDIVPQLAAVVLLVMAAAFANLWLFWVTLFASLALVMVWRMVGQMIAKDGRTYGDVLSDVLVSALIPIYVPFLASMTLLLLRQENGQWWILGFIIVVVAADTGAYGVGVALGRHPMVPKISPKKTWEGFAGAVAASTIAATLISVFMLGLPWWLGPVFGLVVLLTATMGDLAESMIKRDIGIKDMSSWIPGHGGVLDRIDSILPSAAAALVLFHVLPLWAGGA